MFYIGSCALTRRYHWDRKVNDIDIVGSMDEVTRYVNCIRGPLHRAYPVNDGRKWIYRKGDWWIEAEITWPGSTAEELAQYVASDLVANAPHLDVLLMLKMSHRYKRNSPHFLKTMKDIRMMRSLGAAMRPDFMDWFQRREAETYDYAHPNLNQSKEGFFDGSVIYPPDHDSIHRAVAQLDKPAYLYYKPDDREVWCSEEMFNRLSHRTKLYGVLEEAYVLALERSQVPHDFRPDPDWSFDTALMKVCTSITSGWFREFAWENYDAVKNLYDPAYVEWFHDALDKGIIIPAKGD